MCSGDCRYGSCPQCDYAKELASHERNVAEAKASSERIRIKARREALREVREAAHATGLAESAEYQGELAARDFIAALDLIEKRET